MKPIETPAEAQSRKEIPWEKEVAIPVRSSAPLRLCAMLIICALCAICGACSTPNAPQVTEIGSAVGGSYTNPKTGEEYSGQASSYVKFQGKLTGTYGNPAFKDATDPKQVKEPTSIP